MTTHNHHHDQEKQEALSIRVWVGETMEIFRQPGGHSDVSMTTGIVQGEHVLSIRRVELGRPREIRLGGVDLERMLKVLSADDRYRQLFNPEWLETFPRPRTQPDAPVRKRRLRPRMRAV